MKKKVLWEQLRKRHKTSHEDQWHKTNKTRKSKVNTYEDVSAPKVPDEWNNNPNAWLSDEDISKAMLLYENKFKDFHFLEPAPIDFNAKDEYGRCDIVIYVIIITLI